MAPESLVNIIKSANYPCLFESYTYVLVLTLLYLHYRHALRNCRPLAILASNEYHFAIRVVTAAGIHVLL